MLTRVRIQDFQSISKLELDVGAPVVLFTGPSDNGKSAILRAINTAVARGVGGSYFRIKKNGKTSGSMLVELDALRPDGSTTSVVWEKTKKNARYTVNDRVFDNCGKTVPDAVPGELGMDSVRDLGEFLHYRSQHDKHFLLADRGPKDAYRFLSTILGADVVIQVLNEVESRRRKINDTASFAETQLVSEQKQLDSYFSEQAVVDAERLYVAAQVVAKGYAALRERKAALEGIAAAKTALSEKEAYIEKAAVILRRIETVCAAAEESSLKVGTAQERMAAANRVSVGLDSVSALDSASKELEAVVAVDISRLSVLTAELDSLKARVQGVTSVQAAMADLDKKVLPVHLPLLEKFAVDAGFAANTADVLAGRRGAVQEISTAMTAMTALQERAEMEKRVIASEEEQKRAVQDMLGCGGDIERCPFMRERGK